MDASGGFVLHGSYRFFFCGNCFYKLVTGPKTEGSWSNSFMVEEQKTEVRARIGKRSKAARCLGRGLFREQFSYSVNSLRSARRALTKFRRRLFEDTEYGSEHQDGSGKTETKAEERQRRSPGSSHGCLLKDSVSTNAQCGGFFLLRSARPKKWQVFTWPFLFFTF